MKLLSKFFLAVLLLTVASVSWAGCPEGEKQTYKGCEPDSEMAAAHEAVRKAHELLQAAKTPEEREELAEQVLINPVIQPCSEELEVGWEGCLSVPELRGAVPRHTRIHYQGLDEKGALIDQEAYGFHARVVQHECDHLEGILYPMRMTDLTSLHYTSEMRFNAETFSVSEDS